jgi:ABC-type Mn2+/Zn2+ transport system permease subunit
LIREYLFTLSFVLIPLYTAVIFAVVTPPLGATLSLRNEILLGIALPPVGSAVIAGAMLAGVSPDATLLLYILAAGTLFLIMILLPLSVGKKQISMRRRELILAALFCIGNTLTILFMALSPNVEAHFKNLLQGEILAVTNTDLIVTVIGAVALLITGFRYRGVLYAYSLDEEGLRIKEKSYTTITVLYRAAATIIITGGIVLIGPLLTTSLLIVPAFFIEQRSRGLEHFMIISMILGVTGTMSGFLFAVATDYPPAVVAVCAITAGGICYHLFSRRNSS